MSTMSRTRSRTRRSVLPLAAAAVVGALLPVGVSPVQAVEPRAQEKVVLAKAAEPGFVGYSTTAAGSPMKVEIYEPTIPLPATPQGELNYGYTAIVADSTSARARSSYLWPGGPVGEGFKTIAENLGLPPEISGPLGEGGYPIQVNAVFPGGPEEQSDEAVPGSIQRARAVQDQAEAINGYSSDGAPDDEEETDGNGNGNGDGGGGGLPLPELPVPGLPVPALPGLSSGSSSGSGGSGGVLGRKAPTKRSTAAADAAPLLPPELAALVDIGGFTSVSTSNVNKIAFSRSRANVSDITVLGGAVTIKSIKTLSRTSSDGAKGVAEGEAQYGDLIAFGQRFKYGADGYEAAGQGGSIPGLPDDGAKALAQLGLAISTPKPTYSIEGDAAGATVPGIIFDFDLTVLRSQLGPLTGALNDILAQIPAETGKLKSLIQAAANLSPRIVFTLGYSTSSVDTSQPIEIPEIDIDTTDPEPTDTGGGSSSSGGSGSVSSGGESSVPDSGAPVGGESAPVSTDTGIVPVAAAQQPGLPALFSIPTLMILLGIGLASLFGSYVRRLGLAALGGSTSCPHGLTSGLPDLRKMA